jgi:hypothetical protein
MTKKHFAKLAACIKEIKEALYREKMCKAIGDVCASCNENFDWLKWRNACGCKETS